MFHLVKNEIHGMTVGELEQRMTSRELSEWMALSNVEMEEEKERRIQREAESKLNQNRGSRGHYR